MIGDMKNNGQHQHAALAVEALLDAKEANKDENSKTPMLWGFVDHAEADAVKRQVSACNKDITPVSVDAGLGIGVFAGSSKNYSTTLGKCECVDFSKRKLPCKHMYRLAHELGIFELPAKVSVGGDPTLRQQRTRQLEELQKDVPYTADQIVGQLPEYDARILKHMLNFVHFQKCCLFRIAPPDSDASLAIASIVKLGLIYETPDTPETALRFYRIDEIKEFLKSRNLPVPTARQWKVIGPVALEQIPDVLLANLPSKTNGTLYKFSPIFEPIWGKLYNKLTKVYPGTLLEVDETLEIYRDGLGWIDKVVE
ncbi:MAG: SWIM zinc finger family protein [Treponema sp.]|nr:SWIM zinc finger family protein [Treponema sp.]